MERIPSYVTVCIRGTGSNEKNTHKTLALELSPRYKGTCCFRSSVVQFFILQVLSREFSPRHVVFLTDVSGIYDRPPDTPGMV